MVRSTKTRLLCAAVWTVLAAPVAGVRAQAPGEGGVAVASVRAVAREAPVRLDGRMTEAAWRPAPAADDFVQAVPREGSEPARPTSVRILHDEQALYVGARLRDDPSLIRDQLVRRDGRGAFDAFRIELDPNGDNRTGYLFQVSAAGAQRDAYLFDDVRVDPSWDAVWASAVHRDSAGWSVEMRIPFTQFDYRPPGDGARWGVNLVRRRLASDSRSMLVLRSRTRAGRVSQFGDLAGVRAPRGTALELRPYGATRLRTAPADPADPFFDGSSLTPRLGLGASWKVTSNFTVDATFNPDFGQVEVDPAVVNLSAFETFFPEKRPFFTEDARLFDFPLSGAHRVLFHTRRIGREPAVAGPDGADFVDVPDATTILGAAKATGRTAAGTTLGLLGAVTAEETGRAFFRGTGRTESFVAHPREFHGAGRIRQDLRGGATTLGAMATGVRREPPASSGLDHLPETAVAGGADFEHQWGGSRDRRYALWGYLSGSYVQGTPEAMIRLQTDANHYFQRPDADYKSVDSTTTSMTGREWRLQIERRSAEHWTWRAWVNEVSPGYVVDEVGFAGSTLPRIDVGGQLRYQDISPGPLFRSWSVRLNTFHNFRHSLMDAPLEPDQWADSHQGGRFLLGGRFELPGAWRIRLSTEWAPGDRTERETRGGPLMVDPGSLAFQGSVQTDPRAAVNLFALASWREGNRGGDELAARLALEVRPASNWEIRLGPAYTRIRDPAQFVATTDAVAYAPTFGRRHLFADVVRDELSVETHLDVAFTPDLSLQLYAQPLLASGDFTSYKQLARPSSFAFLRFDEGRTDVGPGSGVVCRGGATCARDGRRHVDFDGDGRSDFAFPDRDFNLASLRGNAVLRWEYGPGSELFLVWQQDRRRRLSSGSFLPGRSLDRLLAAPGSHRVILKVRHHLSF